MKITYKKISILIIIFLTVALLLIIYYLPMKLIDTIDTEQKLHLMVGKFYTDNSVPRVKSSQYKLIYNTNTHNKFVEYISKYNYRRKYNTFFKKTLTSLPVEHYIVSLVSESGSYFEVGGEGEMSTGEHSFTYKIIFNDDDNINKFVENIIEICEEKE